MRIKAICDECKTINTIDIGDIRSDIFGRMQMYETIDDIHDVEVECIDNSKVRVKYTCENKKCNQRNEIEVTINRR